MESLSDEILLRIFSVLTARDLCRCSQVSIIFIKWFVLVQFCVNRPVDKNNQGLPYNLSYLFISGVFCLVSSSKRFPFVSFQTV